MIAVEAKFFQLQSAHSLVQYVQSTTIFIRFPATVCKASCMFSSPISFQTFFKNVFQINMKDSFHHPLQAFLINSLVIQFHFQSNTSFGLTNSRELCIVADKKLYHIAFFHVNQCLIAS
jgi:hypothetical protein